MSNNAELQRLEAQLERAEKAYARAVDVYISCTLNTPGRCGDEADSVKAAGVWVTTVKAQIRMLEAEAAQP